MQTATHYRARHLSIITGQVLRQQVTVILICNRKSGRGHTGPEVRTGDNEPRRNAPFFFFLLLLLPLILAFPFYEVCSFFSIYLSQPFCPHTYYHFISPSSPLF